MASYWYWSLSYLLCAVFVACLVPLRATEYCSLAGRLNCSLENVNTTYFVAKLPVLPPFPCNCFNCSTVSDLSCCLEDPPTTTVWTSTEETTTESTTTESTTTESTTTESTTPSTITPPTTTPTATTPTPGNSTLGPPVSTSKPSPPTKPGPGKTEGLPIWLIVLLIVLGLILFAVVVFSLLIFFGLITFKQIGAFLTRIRNAISFCNRSNKIKDVDEPKAASAPAGNGKIKVEKHLRPGSIELVPVVEVAQNISSCNTSAPCSEAEKIPLSGEIVLTPHIPDEHTVENETGRSRSVSTGSRAGDTTQLVPNVVTEGKQTKKRKKRGSKGGTELKPLRTRQQSYDINADVQETIS